MHESLKEIPGRILEMALAALVQANTLAVFNGPGTENWEYISVVQAAMAGELAMKAVIALEHPLLIFRDLFSLESADAAELNLQHIIEKGKTYNFEHLPKLLWVVTGERLSDFAAFERLRSARNSIQHFCAPDEPSLNTLALEFLYRNIDPLLNRHFSLCAIDCCSKISDDRDYLVHSLIANELLFSVPEDFSLGEFDLAEELAATSDNYRLEMERRIAASQS